MSRTIEPESAVRSRTRRAILAAGAAALARNRTATLADIAEAADVGRSTLHRYFSDRDELVNAVIDDSLRVLDESFTDAAIDQGPPLAAMRRLVTAMVDAGDHVLFLYGDPSVLDRIQADDPDPAAAAVLDLIERGQRAGVFDPEVSAAWIEHVLWGLVYTGCEAVRRGRLPRHGAPAQVIRSLENGIRVRPRD